MPLRLAALCAVLALALVACGDDDGGDDAASPPPQTTTATIPADGELARSDGEPEVTTIAEGLDVPWEIAFLPDRRALISERPGTIRLLSADGELRDEPLAEVQRVEAEGEGGLLGLAVDPQFDDNGFVYAYRTTADGNEVVRLRLDGESLTEQATIVENIPAGAIHNGGRLGVGPDDRLYITTGDAGDEGSSQRDGLAGKVLRMEPAAYRGDGATPETFTTGHRNPQGLAWQPGSDRLFSTEHGPTGDDEVNVLRAGRNYGWPEAQGTDHGDFEAPAAVYGDETIAPSGATFVTLPDSAWTGDLLFGGLAGTQIRRLQVDGATVTSQQALLGDQLGRTRTVVEGPDGALYALTSNTDGRGSPRDGDDRLMRIVPPRG
ncbi:MAG: PQQ-dependent sugar dehydrogenase [Solirubrobacteraceae bacterium]|nr:PQQ-dependent sugar dehydrogenase [Solirubrobacteraceae bacterium]